MRAFIPLRGLIRSFVLIRLFVTIRLFVIIRLFVLICVRVLIPLRVLVRFQCPDQHARFYQVYVYSPNFAIAKSLGNCTKCFHCAQVLIKSNNILPYP